MINKKSSLYIITGALLVFLDFNFLLANHRIKYANEYSNSKTPMITPYQPLITELQPLKEKKHLDFYQKIEQTLYQSVASFDGIAGVTYIDLTTEKQLSINGDTTFYTASTIKVPLAIMTADAVASGNLRWEDQISYNLTDYEEGTGIIINNTQPSYSLRELQDYNIIYSDNIAKNMLYTALGGDEKVKEQMYQHFWHRTPKKLDEIDITPNEAASVLLQLYKEKETNNDYQKIYENMKNTAFHERLETTKTSRKVAHKIGSYDEFIHDIGILEAEHPFILTVYTKGNDGIAYIESLVDQIWQIQNNEYPNNES